ncbi:pyridoxamine 5'-phosphate oxidase family protein [uncultured Roseobacter sp.]|uniref:FAD-binding oxidoreductase n=1 Tax=uncultured Roseobacter sp. TaxID=114847 RepID=UPI00261AAD54|nr:pyridoxamine 5'-phosphate oxidase family protein [uncultured Roseobacter sp.]
MPDTIQSDISMSPFHQGEHLAQERLGVRGIEDWARQVVRDHLPEQHREFHTALPFLVVAARDGQDRPWVTLLEGPDGFITSPDNQALSIGALPGPGDALHDSILPGSDIGILGIELATRRRNRVNGRAAGVTATGFDFRVDQSFGNCPQYIRERNWRREAGAVRCQTTRGRRLTTEQARWIASADTFFIASGYRGEGESATFGMDASHRGGDRGFVEVPDDRRLRFPDYAGNNHFNTIGNILLDPKAGLLFVDFASGSFLQLTGKASIDWDSGALARFPGARRLVTLEIDEVVETRSAASLRWATDADSVRSIRLVEKTPESADVTSFVFEARDGGPLAGFEPGQHLPIELDIPGIGEPVSRTYSLSNGPNEHRYRITVKREPKGIASRFLHDHLEPGAIINSRRPAGDFVMTCNKCPLVLVSAGVGVTPMMSILQAVAGERGNRPVWFVHGARDVQHHPLALEVRDLASSRSGITVHVAYSQPGLEDEIAVDYDSHGRIDGALLARLINNVDAHYFICGPTKFMGTLQADLQGRGVLPEHIHTESFGPAG